MNTTSIWMSNAQKTKSYPELTEDIEVEVAIVGGGITGITAALNLLESGKKVALLEANTIGSGTTGFSTGNLYVAIQPYYHKILSIFDEKTVQLVADSRKSTIDTIENIVNQYGLHCGFHRRPWYLFAKSDPEIKTLTKEFDILHKVGQNIEYVDSLPYDLQFKKAVLMKNQARINPYEYVTQLAEKLSEKGCLLFENSRVMQFHEETNGCVVKTAKAKIKAKHLIIATHTPIGVNKFNVLTAPYRSYAVAAKRKNNEYPEGHFWDLEHPHHVTCSHTASQGKPDLIIVSGNHHKTGQDKDSELRYHQLERFLQKNYDISEIVYRWSAQHYHASDGLPFIGYANHNAKHTYVATGFFADGLIYGTMAGIILADIIQGKTNLLDKIYNSNRIKPFTTGPFLLKEGINILKQYLKDLPTFKNQTQFGHIKVNQGKVVEIKGEKFCVYRDKKEKIHLLSAHCTHMKCLVNWNTAENTWDCPCHGSRFTAEGKVIEGPAIRDLPQFKESEL